MKIGVSACLIGKKCNFNGEDLLSAFINTLNDSNSFELISYCPEDSIFGSPRPNLRIVGGDGNDVLDGKAKVINQEGEDVTELQILAAERILSFFKKNSVEHAFLMDGSPSCGSKILLAEKEWPKGGFKKGVGVSTALLKRNGIKVFSSFDEKAIDQFLSKNISEYKTDPKLKNLIDNPKFEMLLK